MTTEEILKDIVARLERIEKRQISTTEMVKDIEEHEGPTVGSFGTADLGEK